MTISSLFQRTLLLASLSIFSVSAQAMSVEDFSRHPEFYDVKISPDGKYLAVLINTDGRKTLAFLDSKTFEVQSSIGGGQKDQVGSFFWVNNERVLVGVEQVQGALLQPLNYGEIFAVNYDGSKKKMLFGYRSREGGYESGWLVDPLKGQDKYVLIQTRQWEWRTGATPEIQRLNVYSGKTLRIKQGPMRDSNFLIDNQGKARFASGLDSDYKNHLYYSDDRGEKWQRVKNFSGKNISLMSFTPDNNGVYALMSEKGEPSSLYRLDIKTQQTKELYRSKSAEPTELLKTDVNEVYGLRIDEDYPNYLYIKPDSNDALLHKALVRAFNGDNVIISSKTDDGKLAVVHVTGDRNPGVFYLFDTQSMQARELMRSREWIKANELAATQPFRLKSKDGLTLNGYLTLPKGKQSNLPTVIMPHGGPHVRDYWQYNSRVQLLASRGYAVVQINFRGSTGYGEEFVEAGYGHWGTDIQQDIIDAANYVIRDGVADKDRLCIFGGSFGGYSALQSAIIEPELFKCAIGYAGVYDLEMLFTEGDIENLKWGDAYLEKTVGNDKAELRRQSPVYNVDKLKAPVLIIHGEDDERAPIEHAEALREALDKANHPYEWLVKDKEGHGFYLEENIVEANQKVLAFLKQHIGD
ncbi:alpha/beta hydrolase family protein [Paraferrimonas haliotis]|uniref:Peptidase S9 n=1 Tax=Paraferrimonas haliotis TaxID=2013866 RepID=A0AA37WWH6_9GAMM|nr:S9 family peptidase [Paraferrimonas haliotis]GLS83553.1 peptidase S9 [Paraferrimonas haliotis]